MVSNCCRALVITAKKESEMPDTQTEIDELKAKVTELEESLRVERESNEEYFKKIKTVYDLIYESGDIESRAVLDDLQLLRELYVRFKSFRFLLGVLFGILTVVLPVILGGMKVVDMVSQWAESTGS